MDEITERTGGKITFETFWGGALSGPFDTFDLLEEGIIDLAHTMPWYLESKFPLANYEFTFPLFTEDPALVGPAKHQLVKEIPAFQEMWAQYNMRNIYAWPSMSYGWNSVEPLTKLEDFNGRKFTAASRWQSKWMEAAGLTMIGASVADVYELHQTGVAEGNVLPIGLNLGLKVYEVAPYYLHGYGSYAYATLIANLDTWNELGPEVQKIFEEVSEEAMVWFPPTLLEEEARLRGIMEEQGVTFSFMGPEFRQAWLDIIPDVPAIWAAEVTEAGWPGWEIVDRWQEILADMGYTAPRQWGVR